MDAQALVKELQEKIQFKDDMIGMLNHMISEGNQFVSKEFICRKRNELEDERINLVMRLEMAKNQQKGEYLS